MPQSLVCLPVHFIFSTKGRETWIRDEWAARLYEYVGGIAHGEKCVLLAAGGMPDHVHLLVSVGRTIALTDLMRLVKANSSKWVHETFPGQPFAWQNGYGAFAVGHDQVGSCGPILPGRPSTTPAVRTRTSTANYWATMAWSGTNATSGTDPVVRVVPEWV